MTKTHLTRNRKPTALSVNRVQFLFVEENEQMGIECSACGERFFDDTGGSAVSYIEKAIDHTNEQHSPK